MDEKPVIPRHARIMYLGIILVCLGVVFMSRGSLGVIFLLSGAALVLIGLARKNRS
jgi:hypothetical protein